MRLIPPIPGPTSPPAGHVQYCVLDEADKMLGLGFQPQIQQLKALLLPPAGAAAAAEQDGGAGARKQKKARRVQVGPSWARKQDQSCGCPLPHAKQSSPAEWPT